MGEWGGAPEICARYLRCCCKHLLFIATRAESAEAALATGAVSQAYIVIVIIILFIIARKSAALEPRFI